MIRKYVSIRNFPGIYRILVSHDGKRWLEPKRGGKFAAAKYLGHGSSRRVKMHFKSFEDAKAFKSSRSVELYDVRTKSLSKEGMLFRDLLARYEETELVHRSPSTQDKYKSYFRYYSTLLNLPVKLIDAQKISEWLAWLKSSDTILKQSSRRCNFEHEYTFLRTLLSYYAEVCDQSYRLPFLKRHRDNLKVKDAALVEKDLSPEQFRSFIRCLQDACSGGDERSFYIAYMQYLTYSRIQEAAALHYEDFDLNSGYVRLNKKIVYRRTKGSRPELHTGSKSNEGKRIALSPQLLSIFQEWVIKSGIRSGPLFKKNGEFISYRQIQYAYDKAFKMANIPFTGTHILRHASLSEAQNTCGDLRVTQMLAGHKSSSTTERYTKVRDSKLHEVQMRVAEKVLG